MGKFISRLDVRKTSETDWKLLAPLIYDSETVGMIIVPAGFQTNFASVPRIPLVYWWFGGIGDEACAIHDYLYAHPHETFTRSGTVVDRATADKVLRGVIKEAIPTGWIISKFLISWAMWIGVRLGGESHWEQIDTTKKRYYNTTQIGD